MKCRIFFADEKLNELYESLKNSQTEDRKLYKRISRALKDIKEDCFCGIQIPKKQIPKDYKQKYNAENLWKYNLPNAWRIIYTIKKDEVQIISIILDWLDHTKYERKFKY
ncbi:MAG: type II toxin-antitoxin system YoeB family toxin [Candidatus Altiarchaeota archaeon]